MGINTHHGTWTYEPIGSVRGRLKSAPSISGPLLAALARAMDNFRKN
jgi:hypothetical protein